MTHHVSTFQTAAINFAQSFDEANLRQPPEVTLWFKTEHSRLEFCLWLWKEFQETLLWTTTYDGILRSPERFKSFTFMGVKYTLEVEPE